MKICHAGGDARAAVNSTAAQWSNSHQLPPLPYGPGLDNLFGSAEAAGVRFGMPQPQGNFPKQSASTATVGQPMLPYLTVQCGRFTAPVQRDALSLHQGPISQDIDNWGANQEQGHHRHHFDEQRSSKVSAPTDYKAGC